MSTMNDPDFDVEAFFKTITEFPPEDTEVAQNKLQEKEKWNLLKKKIVKVHVAISKTKKISSELAEREKELSILRNNNKDLLVKYTPLEKKYDELVPEFLQLKAKHAQNQAELEASRCHSNQLQALVKDLESKLEAASIEKSLLSGQTNTRKKLIKHIIMFGKLAASQNKLSNNNLRILKKYSLEVGENDHESDKEIDTIAMPPSCGSVDTGIGSSLAQSDDEKIWSPDSPSVTFEDNISGYGDYIPKQLQNNTLELEEAFDPTIKSAIVNCNATRDKETTINNNVFDMHAQKNESEIFDPNPTERGLKNVTAKKTVLSPNHLIPEAWEHNNEITKIGVGEILLPDNINSATKCKFVKSNLSDMCRPQDADFVGKPNVCKKKSSPGGKVKQKAKNTSKSQIIDMLFNHPKNVEENICDTSKLTIVNGDENSTDSEVESIMKEMIISHKQILSPIPPTPLNVQQALKVKSSRRTQPILNAKDSSKRLNNAKSPLSQKLRKLHLTNFKLNKVICRQRRQLLTANRIILKSKKHILDSTEDDFVRLLSLMSKVSSRFNIEEKKNNKPTGHQSSVPKGINILEKMCSFVEEHGNVNEVRKAESIKDPHGLIMHSKISKTCTEINKHETRNHEPSPTNNYNEKEDTEKNILQDKEISSANFMSEQQSINRDCPVEIQFGTSSPTCDEDREQIKNKKGPKKSKLSQLEKLKQKLKRKPKIDIDTPPAKKNRKSMDHSISNPKNTEIKSSIELNNKIAYEKALRVMSELKVRNAQKLSNGSSQDLSPRLTRSTFKSKRNSNCSSIFLKTDKKEQDLNGERDNIRNLRSKTRKWADCNQSSIENARKVHTDLDMVDQSSKETRKDQLNYNDLAMFEDPQVNAFIASPAHSPKSHKPPMSNIIEANKDKTTSKIRKNDLLKDCHNSNDFKRQLRSRVTSPEGPDSSLPIKPFATHLIDESIENDTCLKDNTSPKPPSKSPPVTRSITYEDTGLTDRALNNINGKINTTNEDSQHQNDFKITSPNKSLENEIGSKVYSKPNSISVTKRTVFRDLEQVDRICNDSVRKKQVEMDEGIPNQDFFKSMLVKYGVKISRRLIPPTIPEKITEEICMQMENCLGEIVDVMPTQLDLDALVARLETRNYKLFIVALLKFLTSEKRSKDILCKAYTPPLPPMTKCEQALLYLLSALQNEWNSIDLFNEIMKNIEYKLFRLGYAPHVTQVENLSRFYAVLCRFRKSIKRLRLFMVDAMYCMNFKAIPLIKQCVDVWMHVLPLSHMRSAKNPLVLTIVYLVFFFHSNDPKVRGTNDLDILKFTLIKRYSFLVDNFTEKIIIDRLRECIVELSAKTKQGQRVLSTALILLSKRNGVKWCQKKIVDGMLIPLIKNETTPEPSKAFSISILGSLLKPYPDNMKLHCEMAVNQLLLLMERKSSFVIEQAILTSLIMLRRHNKLRPLEILQSWKPRGKISPELEDQIKILIQEQPLQNWIKSLCDKSNL